MTKLREMGKPPFCWYSYSFTRGWCYVRWRQTLKSMTLSLSSLLCCLPYTHYHCRYVAMCLIITVWVSTKRCFRKKRGLSCKIFLPKKTHFFCQNVTLAEVIANAKGWKKRQAATWLFPSFFLFRLLFVFGQLFKRNLRQF